MPNKPRISLAVAVCTTLASGAAFATNGYFTHGLGTKNKSMAGAGTASPLEAMSITNNPASAVMLGKTYEVGLSIFSPRRSYKTTDSQLNGQLGSFTVGPNDLDSKNEYFPIPYAAGVWPLSETSAFAAAFYGRGGMNTEFQGGTATFDPDGPGPGGTVTLPGSFGAGKLGVDLIQAFVDLTYSFNTGPVNWGITGVLAAQSFEVDGMLNFAGFTETFAASGGAEFPQNLSNKGNEWSFGYGLKLGVIWEATEAINLGASYQTVTYMSDLDNYSDLLAQGGGFDIPASARIGISWQINDSIALHLDGERIWYSDIDSIGNSIKGVVNCPTAGFGGTDTSYCLGGKNGIGFGWDDMDVVKVGAEWNLHNSWILRAGYSTTTQPIPDDELLVNILAPGITEEHITMGFTRELADGREINLSFMWAPENRVKGKNSFDPTQDIILKMDLFELEIGYAW